MCCIRERSCPKFSLQIQKLRNGKEEKSDFLCRARERSVTLTERIKGQPSFIPQILVVSVTRGAGRSETMPGKSRRERRIFGERDGIAVQRQGSKEKR